MRVLKFTPWQDDDFFIGFLNEYPDYQTQGNTREELLENLKELLIDLKSGQVPYVHNVEELMVASSLELPRVNRTKGSYLLTPRRCMTQPAQPPKFLRNIWLTAKLFSSVKQANQTGITSFGMKVELKRNWAHDLSGIGRKPGD